MFADEAQVRDFDTTAPMVGNTHDNWSKQGNLKGDSATDTMVHGPGWGESFRTNVIISFSMIKGISERNILGMSGTHVYASK
eukprot:781419-Karenia_brevis.AAC.1